MATEKWIAGSGVGLTWTAANTSSTLYNALANGNALISDLSITNGTALDIFADLSWEAGGTATTAAPNFLGFYLYPLGQDGTTYGDGRFGSAAAGPPPGNYWVGNIGFAAAASTTIAGVLTRIIIPPGTFSWLVYNQSGATLANTNVFKYRTYNRSIV
jgi:hypothetical protein